MRKQAQVWDQCTLEEAVSFMETYCDNCTIETSGKSWRQWLYEGKVIAIYDRGEFQVLYADAENPWTQEIPTKPGYYWVITSTRIALDLDIKAIEPTEPWMLNVQRWGDCAPADQLSQINDWNTLVVVRYYDQGVLHYDVLNYEGWYCPVERAAPLPNELLEQFRANMD